MTIVAHDSPIGPLTLKSDVGTLVGVWFEGDDDAPEPDRSIVADRLIDRTRRELDRYFAGRLQEFTVPVRPSGTAFQQAVWAALRTIPFGETRSYGAIARQIRRPAAVRAVGAANGANPIPVIIPCHRVIGANGSLTGFGGGMERKRFLLDLEQGAASML